MESSKDKSIIRLKKIEGQVRGLQKMIEEDAYCIDVITQTSAVRSALKSLEDVVLESHLQSCVIDQVTSGQEDKAVSEILKVYKLKR